MKRVFPILLLMLAIAPSHTKAQNIQLLYDTGRNCVTSTVEMFRPDGGGSTFFFVDFDYSPKAIGAYWELSRELNFWQDSDLAWLSVHLEYNGGLNNTAGPFNNAYLAGLTYSGHSNDWSKTWSLSALYKAIPGTLNHLGKCDMHNFQITGVYNISFGGGWCEFSGFFDFWREAYPWQGTNYIFMTEPQLWINLSKIRGLEKLPLRIGGEVEISNNFIHKGLAIMPAVGIKWIFD